MKSYGHKCQHQALLKVGTLKANKQPQDELMRHLSSGTQSSPLATTHDGLRRSFHRLTKCSWMKVPTIPEHQ